MSTAPNQHPGPAQATPVTAAAETGTNPKSYHGQRLVWIVDVTLETVTAYRPEGPPGSVGRGQTLRGDAVLPDFELPVDERFGEAP